jgi:hypothetical protein
MVQRTAAADAPRRQWIQSRGWDAFWIFSGLWAPLSVLLLHAAMSGGDLHGLREAPAFHQQRFVLLFTSLALLHRLSSIHAVLLSPAMRRELRANRRRYVYAPLATFVLTLLLAEAFVFHPLFSFLGTQRGQLWAFFVLGIGYILWDRWHFCMQEFGVLSLYRARAEQRAKADRLFDRVFVVCLMLGVNTLLYVNAGFGDDRDLLWLGTPVAALQGAPLQRAALGACALALLLTAAAVVREALHPQRSWPKLAYYALIGSHSLILYLLPNALSLFFLSYVFHHWMVAVGLFNLITLNGSEQRSAPKRALAYVLHVGPWFIACLLLGMFFEPLDITARLTPIPNLHIFEGAGTLVRAGVGLVIGSIFGFSFLHYYYDRCLYSFSVPGVRAAIGPLLLGPPKHAPATPVGSPASASQAPAHS